MASAFPSPDPGAIMDALCAFQLTEALKGAIELEVFTHIGDGADTATAIAERAGASERSACAGSWGRGGGSVLGRH